MQPEDVPLRRALAFAAAITIVLSGCGGSTQPAAPAAAPASTAVTPAQPPPAPVTTTVSDIQNRSGWQWCSATTNSGFPCAAGIGKAESGIAQNQPAPSVSGHSAQFFLGGSQGYSNALWWNELGANSKPAHFDYDFWIYSADPGASQALEFDVNQSFDGTRYVFGTQCNIYAGGHWDVWDSSGQWGHWVTTKLGCPVLQPNTWAHLTWHFERSDTKVHYISLTVNGTDYPVDVWLAAQPNWKSDELNVAVQLDGNAKQQPYSVFLDNMSLTYW